MKKDFKNMTDEELDKELERLPRIYQKACMITAIKKVKPNYQTVNERRILNEYNNNRKRFKSNRSN